MSFAQFRIAAGVCCAWLLLLAAEPRAEDWIQESFDVQAVKKGFISMEFPEYWGKPEHRGIENITEIDFGPFGPRSKPVFHVSLRSVPLVSEISDDNLTEVTKAEASALLAVAFETEIPINSLSGPHNSIRYFSITDKEKKYGEFEYLTLAVIASGTLLTKCYFYSSDGAPDFGPDAVRFMESIHFTAPPPKKEESPE